VQQAQQNYLLAFAFLVLGTLLAPTLSAAAGGPDPLLTEAKGPCDPRLDEPDYVAGTDANGNPVAPADLSAGKVPTPKGVLVPLAGRSGRRGRAQAYAELDQKDVDSILNPRPACPPARKAH